MSAEVEILDWIEENREAILEFVIEFCNVPSPQGEERAASDFLYEWLLDQHVTARQQFVTEDRPNVIGIIDDGHRTGDSLLLNAHIDTAAGAGVDDPTVTDDARRILNGAWREDEYLLGEGVANDKGMLSALMWAGRALAECDVSLGNRLVLTGVVGETAGATIDEFQDLKHLGSGIGSRRLIDGGVTADYALVAETTDYTIGRMECGMAFFKITVHGSNRYLPRLETMDPDEVGENHPSAILKASRVVQELEQWGATFRQENEIRYEHGIQRGSASVGAIRSGSPHAPVSVPGTATVYLGVMLPAGENPDYVLNDLEDTVAAAGVGDCSVEAYGFRRGYIADDEDVSGLVGAIEAASEVVTGEPTGRPHPAITSMWRDINVFNEVGIPAVTYGPSRSPEPYSDSGNRCLHADDLIDAVKLYALTALDICGCE